MADIPLANAQIVWTLAEGEDGPALRVVGGPEKDDDRYLSSWGACNSDFNEASDAEKLRMLLAESVNLTLNENIPPRVVHEALMAIPEYRTAMVEASVIPPTDEPE